MSDGKINILYDFNNRKPHVNNNQKHSCPYGTHNKYTKYLHVMLWPRIKCNAYLKQATYIHICINNDYWFI